MISSKIHSVGFLSVRRGFKTYNRDKGWWTEDMILSVELNVCREHASDKSVRSCLRRVLPFRGSALKHAGFENNEWWLWGLSADFNL